jgi:hypothetical protein
MTIKLDQIVISAFPGTGKTYLCAKSRRCLVEKECWEFSKAANFPENYVSEIKHSIGGADAVFISTNKQALDMLIVDGIPVILVYPVIELKNEYMERYVERGSHPDFIDAMNTYWERWLEELNKRSDCKKHVLQAGQFIENAMPWLV